MEEMKAGRQLETGSPKASKATGRISPSVVHDREVLKGSEQKSKMVCLRGERIFQATELRTDWRRPLQIQNAEDGNICKERAGGRDWISDMF